MGKKGKKRGKNRKRGRRDRKAGKNIVTEDRLRCENIGSVFYSIIKPYLKLSEKGLPSKW